MNRRNFLGKLAGAVAAFTVLPSATTYERIWKPKLIEPALTVNPEWVTAEYELWTWKYETAAAFVEWEKQIIPVLHKRSPTS